MLKNILVTLENLRTSTWHKSIWKLYRPELVNDRKIGEFFVFDLILYVPSTIFQL